MLLEEQPICRRCGFCCHIVVDGKIIKCKNLIKLSNGKTICRIYNHRLGFKVYDSYRCGMRADCKQNFKDCPYNVEGQPMSIIGWNK